MAARRTRNRRNSESLEMKMKNWILLPLVLLVIGLAVYHFMMASKNQTKQTVVLQTLMADCNPVEAVCTARMKQHVVTLHFPEKVVYLQPFKMRVTIEGLPEIEPEKLVVDFKMVGMDMGLNRYTLSPITDESGNVYFQGEAILPVCVSGRVDWVANIQAETNDKIYEAVFEFKVTKG